MYVMGLQSYYKGWNLTGDKSKNLPNLQQASWKIKFFYVNILFGCVGPNEKNILKFKFHALELCERMEWVELFPVI